MKIFGLALALIATFCPVGTEVMTSPSGIGFWLSCSFSKSTQNCDIVESIN
jgi:hypothetical protein